MMHEDGRVTLLPEQIRRLAALSELQPCAIEVVQTGNVVKLNNGFVSLTVSASGDDIPPPNQESLC
jgi:hypothetical protein